MKPSLHIIISLILLSTCLACNQEVIGTYKYFEKSELGKSTRLVLFEDNTFEQTWWTDILKYDRGKWLLKSDTVVLDKRGTDINDYYIFNNNKLYKVGDDGNQAVSWEYRKSSRKTFKLLFE